MSKAFLRAPEGGKTTKPNRHDSAVCPACSNPFHPRRSQRGQTYCSNRCRLQAFSKAGSANNFKRRNFIESIGFKIDFWNKVKHMSETQIERLTLIQPQFIKSRRTLDGINQLDLQIMKRLIEQLQGKINNVEGVSDTQEFSTKLADNPAPVLARTELWRKPDWAVRQLWRETGLLEDLCPHGVGHPNADFLKNPPDDKFKEEGWGIHGCCQESCCSKQ